MYRAHIEKMIRKNYDALGKQYFWILGDVGSKGGAAMRALAFPTNVAQVQIPASTPNVGWHCFLFSPLLREFFLRVLPVFPRLKTKIFQIPFRPGIR